MVSPRCAAADWSMKKRTRPSAMTKWMIPRCAAVRGVGDGEDRPAASAATNCPAGSRDEGDLAAVGAGRRVHPPDR